MIIHDSDSIRIIDETDEKKFITIDNGTDMVTVEVNEQTLENLFDDLVDYFASKAESEIDSDTLAEMSMSAEKRDNVLKIR